MPRLLLLLWVIVVLLAQVTAWRSIAVLEID